ncbi:putative membrane domain protein [[Clostridium] sordellii ATCC 9714]|nr:putative membrane domain protein [[Clostridium] sordellii ATCC 9714] [Paeniclostridium sordellii ATCC 9714]
MLNGSHESIKTFDQSIRKLDKQFSILNLKFVKLFDTYESQSDIFSEIAVSIKESEKNIKFVNQSQTTIKDYIKDVNAGFALYERNIQDLMMKLINHENSLLVKENSIKNINVNLSSDINNLSKIINNQADSITNKLDLVFKYIDLYKEAMDISKAIEDNSDLLETFEEEKISKLDNLYELENTNQTFDLDELDEEELEYD